VNVLFHPEALREFIDAVDYYDDISSGLGIDFLKEIHEGIGLMSQYPLAWPAISRNVRRYMLHRFPYGLIYRQDKDGLYILAVMMLNREPDYWKHRH
jgi:hypothetical protein